jgi:hypothetical protein
MINRLAVNHLPADVPAFMKTPEAIAEIEYLGPEPDRWRSPLEPELVNQQANRDTKPIEQSVLYYAGWLGHYVADGAQPLHVTINHDGWVAKENPKGFTTEHGIHWKFESTFVISSNIKPADVEAKMTPVHAESDVFTDYLAYLRQSGTHIDQLYEFEKAKAFEDAGTAESRAFTADRLAAGASMLRDLIYTAWLESAKPVPPRDFAPTPTPKK